MTFKELSKRVKRLKNDINDIVLDAVITHSDEVTDLQVSQLEDGIHPDGKNITPQYASDAYAKFKKALGSAAPMGTPDLKLTGAFHRGVNVKRSGKYVVIDSSDKKTKSLEEKYNGLFGFAPQNKPTLVNIILETVQKEVLNALTK